ncbi:MAG: sulfatase family protein [Polaribacter sp.]|uniref:sulfatase family protein n=1 Tax=Polaribacter sp. TaxID=1920175 RepID=UPI003EF9AFF3
MKLIKYVAFTFLVLLAISSCKKTSEKVVINDVKSQQPNIIWLMAEDMSTDLEIYGMPNVKTPYLNKMASEGIRFDNAFVTNPICSPSRSAMMIGTHQVKTNSQHHRSNRKVPLDSIYKPFTKLLRDVGYTTILGHHGVMKKGRKIDVNFKSKPIGKWDGKTEFGLFDKYDTFTKEDQPFFAQIQLDVTHRGDWWDDVREKSKHPVDAKTVTLPPYMADDPAIRLDWAKYLDQIEYMDNEVGMIFNELEDKGMANNTIVIFIGDNGRCNIRGKGYLQDTGLRIPFILYYPKQFKGGQVRKDVVSSTDITATIVDFAGIEVPDYMTGKPIFKKDFEREFVYGTRDLWDEIEEKSKAVISEDWSYIKNEKPEIPYDAQQAYLEFYRPAVHVMRKLYKEGKLNDAQKPFFEATKPKEELYNLKEDPHQLNNLASNKKYKEILEKLRVKTLEFEKAMTPDNIVYNPAPVPGLAFVKWFKKEHPKAHQQMKEGVEVGYKKYSKAYKEYLKKSNSK